MGRRHYRRGPQLRPGDAVTGVIAAYAALSLALLPMATEDDLDRRIRLACAAALLALSTLDALGRLWSLS